MSKGKPGAGQQSLFDIGEPDTSKLPTGRSKRYGATGRVRVPKASARTTAWGADAGDDLPQMLAFDSSRVSLGGYNSNTQTLYVKFRDGTPWEYRGVPANVWRNFRRSSSPGRFINRVLNSYDYGKSAGF